MAIIYVDSKRSRNKNKLCKAKKKEFANKPEK